MCVLPIKFVVIVIMWACYITCPVQYDFVLEKTVTWGITLLIYEEFDETEELCHHFLERGRENGGGGLTSSFRRSDILI